MEQETNGENQEKTTQDININITGNVESTTSIVELIVGIFLILTGIFIPIGIAVLRRIRRTPLIWVCILSTILAPLIITWIIALIMSIAGEQKDIRKNNS